jgi:hypothetical protein
VSAGWMSQFRQPRLDADLDLDFPRVSILNSAGVSHRFKMCLGASLSASRSLAFTILFTVRSSGSKTEGSRVRLTSQRSSKRPFQDEKKETLVFNFQWGS